MADLRAFKQIILEKEDREVLYEILDVILECSDKETIIQYYNKKSRKNQEINETQMELEFEDSHQKPLSNVQDESIRKRTGSQAET